MDATPHRFRLERIRSLRERSEEQAKQTFADSVTRERAAAADVALAAARIEAARSALANTAAAATDAAFMLANQAYLERTEAAHVACLKALDGRVREVNVSRHKLVEASRARQSMDRLHDRSLAVHRAEVGRREAATLDEIALNSFRRKVAA